MWVILLAPIGSAGLIGRAIVQYGWNLLGNYAAFTVDIYVGCILVLFGVYPLLLATVAKLNPLQFFKGAWPAIQLAFVSRSSVGTMPVTQQSAIRLGVPKDYASFAVPFGATTKMDAAPPSTRPSPRSSSARSSTCTWASRSTCSSPSSR